MTKATTLTWSEVKRQVLACVEDGARWKQAKAEHLLQMHRAPYQRDDFYGGSGSDLLGWMREGFRAQEIEATAEVRVATIARPMWSEEDGDVDAGRLYGGYDDFYYAVDESERRPGLTLRADLFFAAMVPAKTVHEYGAFLAGLIGALEADGVDLTIEIVLPVTCLWGEDHRAPRHDVRILVKQPGELSDFTEWSALFSPMGTRTLGFAAFGVACDKLGKQQSSHMSRSLDSRTRTYGLEYDESENVLTVTADQRAARFPAERMSDLLNETGLI